MRFWVLDEEGNLGTFGDRYGHLEFNSADRPIVAQFTAEDLQAIIRAGQPGRLIGHAPDHLERDLDGLTDIARAQVDEEAPPQRPIEDQVGDVADYLDDLIQRHQPASEGEDPDKVRRLQLETGLRSALNTLHRAGLGRTARGRVED